MECSIGQERDPQEPVLAGDAMYRGLDGSLWYLGQSTLLREYIGDDLALLFHHLVSLPPISFTQWHRANSVSFFDRGLDTKATFRSRWGGS
jgi:hypothetical protein